MCIRGDGDSFFLIALVWCDVIWKIIHEKYHKDGFSMNFACNYILETVVGLISTIQWLDMNINYKIFTEVSRKNNFWTFMLCN